MFKRAVNVAPVRNARRWIKFVNGSRGLNVVLFFSSVKPHFGVDSLGSALELVSWSLPTLGRYTQDSAGWLLTTDNHFNSL